MNIFGRDYEEIGSKDKGLILNGSGKIKIRWHNKFIDLLDKDGNLNVNVKGSINQISSQDEIKSDGFYYMNGAIVASVGGNIVQLGGSKQSADTRSDNTEQLQQAINDINVIIQQLSQKIQDLEDNLVYTN